MYKNVIKRFNALVSLRTELFIDDGIMYILI